MSIEPHQADPLPPATPSVLAGRRAPQRPNAAFMRAHPAHFIAQGFGSGLSPVVPGTVGTLFGWISFAVLSSRWPQAFNASTWGIVILASFMVGIWACEKTGRDLGVSDHGSMVWDEIVAIWLVLWVLAPADFSSALWAFFWFRVFDMAKPPPIGWFDTNFKGGFGVMLDDIIAAFFTLLLFAIWRSI